MPIHVRIIVIASGIIVLAWLKNQKNQNQKIVECARLTTCQFGNSVMFFLPTLTVWLVMKTLENNF